MSRDYGTDGLDTINLYQPTPAAAITMDAPVDSLGERYRNIVEFDLSSQEVYAAMLVKYPEAWSSYYDEVAPSYTPENSVKLNEAIKFWLYITDSETINVEDYAFGDGLYSDGEEVRVDAPRLSPYMSEGGGTYENPNAAYDQEVYDRVTTNGTVPLPLLEMDGDKDVSSRTVDKPQLSSMYSAEQLAMVEYEISRAAPKSQYDQFGPYATGKNTY